MYVFVPRHPQNQYAITYLSYTSILIITWSELVMYKGI